jgi:hypothetical protein
MKQLVSMVYLKIYLATFLYIHFFLEYSRELGIIIHFALHTYETFFTLTLDGHNCSIFRGILGSEKNIFRGISDHLSAKHDPLVQTTICSYKKQKQVTHPRSCKYWFQPALQIVYHVTVKTHKKSNGGTPIYTILLRIPAAQHAKQAACGTFASRKRPKQKSKAERGQC